MFRGATFCSFFADQNCPIFQTELNFHPVNTSSLWMAQSIKRGSEKKERERELQIKNERKGREGDGCAAKEEEERMGHYTCHQKNKTELD